jgi:type IV secretory pathway VirB2 component (pilin)
MEPTVTITWDQVVQWMSDPVHAGVVGGIAFLFVAGFCSIFARAGWHWSMGLLMAVPGVNLVVFLMLAFGSWPARRELQQLRRLDHAVSKAERRYSQAA